MPSNDSVRSLAEELSRRFARSPEAKAVLGLAEEATDEASRTIRDLFTLTVRTSLGEGEDKVEITTNWELDGDVETIVRPRSADLESRISEFHMRQFEQSLQHRLRLIEAVLRMANIRVSLI